MESLEGFVERFAADVGCYYHKSDSRSLYSLKKYDTDRLGHMGVFGWVQERATKNLFQG
jgi:hypothetical protein